MFSGLFGEDQWQKADKIYIEAYKAHISAHIRLHDGASATLMALATAEVPMAVVSTKRGPLLRSEAAQLGLDGFFISMVGAGDAPADKPDAQAVHFALKETDIAASSKVLFIGDSATDMLAAANAGCTGILIETKPPAETSLAAHPPKHRMKNHAQLIEFLKKEIAGKPAQDRPPPAP